MSKIFMGVRLRSLRQERGMTQVALAQALGISPSYLNQLEQDQRPFTVSVLLKVHRVLGVDIQQFSEDEQARLVAQLSDAVAAVPDLPAVPQAELRELAAKLPQLSQALLALHRRHQQDTQRLHTLADRLSRVGMDEAPGWVDDALPPGQMPFEAVRDFFFAHRNYFDSLDRAAEALAQQAQAQGGALPEWLTQHLRHQHGVFVLRSEAGDAPLRRFDAASRTLHLSADLQPSQQAFQLATQLALLELQPQMQTLLATHHWQDEATRRLASIGLANYVAGALILPYGRFLQAAESLGYDIELLGQRFGVGYEMVCHRLSTLQRSDAPGVPFFFIRVDRAGNISKRQSATHFHFSKSCGMCTRPSPSPGASCRSWPACPMGVCICGLPAASPTKGAVGACRAKPLPLAWAAMCSMRSGWCIPGDWICATCRRPPPLAWAARCASAPLVRSGRFPSRASRCGSIPMRAALCRTAWDSEGPAGKPWRFSGQER